MFMVQLYELTATVPSGNMCSLVSLLLLSTRKSVDVSSAPKMFMRFDVRVIAMYSEARKVVLPHCVAPHMPMLFSALLRRDAVRDGVVTRGLIPDRAVESVFAVRA